MTQYIYIYMNLTNPISTKLNRIGDISDLYVGFKPQPHIEIWNMLSMQLLSNLSLPIRRQLKLDI